MPSRRQLIQLGAGLPALLVPGAAGAQCVSKFSSQVQAAWEPCSSKMRLLSDFHYVDPAGVQWMAPKGWLIDGASIPRFIWSVAGAPFDAPYREASVIHDYYCDTMERSWEETHKVFYDAMITAGTSVAEATSKYWAVHRFGPRWDKTHRWSGMWPAKKPRGPAPYPAPPAPGAPAWTAAPGTPFVAASEPEKLKATAAALAEYGDVASRIEQGALSAADVPAAAAAPLPQ